MTLSPELTDWISSNLVRPTAFSRSELDDLAGLTYLALGDSRSRELIGWYLAHRQYDVTRPVAVQQAMCGVAKRLSKFVHLGASETPYFALRNE